MTNKPIDLNIIRSLEGQFDTSPTAETIRVPEEGLIDIMVKYENAKNHFFRVTSHHKPNPHDVQRALDLYMSASDLYHRAKYRK